MLSLVTLAGMGAAVWMFLSGGGLNQLAVTPAGQQPAAPSTWNSGPAGYPLATPGAVVVQPTTAGSTAPPLGDGPTIRIASFNIEVFGKSKAENAVVINTLAEIVRKFHVVAIQEIRTQDDRHMANFVQIINS